MEGSGGEAGYKRADMEGMVGEISGDGVEVGDKKVIMGAGRRDLREAGDKRVIWRAGRRSRGAGWMQETKR